jgi:lipopolysaccharide/colanic/teichoic acid biosynthesis glycosyltransferase
MIRIFDLLLSLIGIIILSPLFLFLSVWIKFDSNGPVFYKQIRVGRNNKDFLLYKFRSMNTGSDKKGLLTIGGRDPRITNSGYFIRKYKLDEIPQLINVLFGEMSLVGPRPEVRKYVDLYDEKQKKVLSVRPGITDYASIAFSNENEILSKYPEPEKAYIELIMPAKIEKNLVFINHQNFFEYLKIIFLTINKIIK